MRIHFKRSTRIMCAGVVLSLGWFLFASCDCDKTKEDEFPGFWVACVGNQPTLMSYSGDTPVTVSTQPAGQFNPADWDCTHPNSPHYKRSSSPVYPAAPPSGPGGFAKTRAAGTSMAYLPQHLRDLPFLPHVPPPANPACDSSYPDVLQTNHNNALVTRISTCPFQIKARIPVATRPLQVAVTPDGSMALVTSFDNAVNFIDLSSNKVAFTLQTGPAINPNGVAISPDGTRAYITSFNSDSPVVAVIDMGSRSIVATIPTITYPSGATLTPDGSQLWITSPLAGTVAVIDTLSNTNVINLPIAEATDVAFNSTGTRAYITSSAAAPGTVVVVDTARYQVAGSYTVGINPSDIAMSYGDQFLVVNNDDGGSISVIDLVKNSVATAAVGANPSGISFVP